MIPISSVVGGMNILSGLLSPLTKPAEESTEQAAVGTVASSKPQTDPPPGSDAALRSVLARYDVTQITPRQYSQMLEEMRSTGALTEDELNQLGQVLLDLNAENVDPDDEINLLDFYTDRLEKLQGQMQEGGSDEAACSGVAQSLAGVQNRLDWLTKFSLIQASGNAQGLNVLS